jgi:cytochrome c556
VEFGGKIVETFNSKIRSIYGSEALRAFGTCLLVEAAQSLSKKAELKQILPSATPYAGVLKENVSFDPEQFVQGSDPDPQDVLVGFTLTNVPSEASAG